MKIIGLTGGIASGKTTVADYLAQNYRWPVIDADLIARQIYERPDVTQQIEERFGLTDRKELSRLIFSDPHAKKELEAILHPPTIQKIKEQIGSFQEQGREIILLVAPLLVETELADLCSSIIVLDIKSEIQLARLLARQPNLEIHLAQQMIAVQTVPEIRNQAADYIIPNNASPELLFSQVDQIASML